MALAEELQFTEVSEFDESTFDQDKWELTEWRDQKTRHIALHIAKVPLKIIENDEACIIGEVIPDMALYRTQLLQTHQINNTMSDTLMDLQFIRHIDGWRKPVLVAEIQSTGAKDFALKKAAWAGSLLARYLEPLEHGEAVDDIQRQMLVLDAASQLHVGAVSLSQEFGVDIQTALLLRIGK